MSEDWRRAGNKVRTARTRAGLTRHAFAAACGIGKRTLEDVETGARDNFSDDTLDRIEGELGWAEGSIRRIVAGRREIRYDSDLRQLQDLWPRLDRQARSMLLSLAREALDGDHT